MKHSSTLSKPLDDFFLESNSLGQLFFDQANQLQDNVFLSINRDQKIINFTWKAFSQSVLHAVALLQSQGINKGDRIVFIADNSPEYICFTLATLSMGATCCPLSPKLSEKQKNNFINHFNPQLILISNKQLKDFAGFYNNINDDFQIIVMNNTIFNKDKSLDKNLNIKTYLNNISSDDLAYIMLSSGTTGTQKGVKLTHHNILSNQIQLKRAWPFIHQNDIFLSHLPLYHSYGGLSELYQVIYNGCHYHFCKNSDINIIMNEMQLVKPTVFHSIPRIWVKLFIFFNDNNVNTPDKLRTIFNKELKLGFSAGTSLNKRTVAFFNELDFPIHQGYGLTETSPTIAISTPEDFLHYNRAKILPEIDLKFSVDDEILVKGPNVSRGYYNENTQVNNSFTDGYLKTGDLGTNPQTGYLRLIGRKNDVIILSTGEKIIPEPIELRLNEHPFIDQSVLIGNNRQYLSSIIFINRDIFNQSVYNTPDSLSNDLIITDNSILYNEVKDYINNINNDFAEHERIKQFILSLKSLSESEITPTTKLKRQIIEINWQTLIEKLYP